MLHTLDRPIWSTLNSVHQCFAVGEGPARRFQPEISPFAATFKDDVDCLATLKKLCPHNGSIILLQADEVAIPGGMMATRTALGVQMVAEGNIPDCPTDHQAVQLTDDDASEMLALATLTKPGPFLTRTHKLGTFWGIKVDGKLIAMAGERMKLPTHTEVSGICTHPDHRGKGYAELLSSIVMHQIKKVGQTPFLHTYADNERAIRLYEKLGFRLRTMMNVAELAHIS